MAGHSRGKMQCIVLLLDSRQLTILLSPRAFGQELYEAVYRDLQLVETDYFGLEFKAADDTDRWLDKQKPIGAQIGSKSSVLLSFKVKFYPADPTALKEEYTRYLFALQLRQDLAIGRLQCCPPRTAALLAAHVLQSELGDHHEAAAAGGIGNGDDGGEAADDDETAYVRNIKLVAGQTAELERIMVELHRSLSGQRPSEADFNLLDAARKTDFYGVVLNQVKDADGVPQSLAVTETGILVFQNNQRVNVFPWANIRKLCFRRKLFVVKLRQAADKAHPSNFVEFTFATRNRSKAFWKTCVEHHAFFCCQEAPTNQAKHWQSQVLTRGSTFRYSGRTQVQLIDHVKDNLVKSRPFVRSQSFGTMASVRSCGTGSSLGSTARTLPGAVRTGAPAAASSAVVTASNFSASPRLVPKAGTASSDRLAISAAVRASPGKAVLGHENGRADDVHATALASAAAERCPPSEHDPEPVGPSWPSQLQQLAQMPSSHGADAVRAGTTSAGQPSNGGRSNVDGGRGGGDRPSSSSSSSAAEAGADNDDADDVDDAESLAKLEDAIRSLAAAELGATEASAAAGGGSGKPEASSQRRLAWSSAEAERAARQQARDEVLVACRASSLRRSLRRLSTRSTEEEMAQLEDVSDLAVRVMHADSVAAAGGELSPAEEWRPQLPSLSPAPALGDWTAPVAAAGALGRGRRLSSLQDLCELASKVMQYDGELAVSTPLLAAGSSGSIPSSSATAVAQTDAQSFAQPGRAELSPSPPPLPIKQLGSADAQPPAKVRLTPLKPDVTFGGRGGSDGHSLGVAAAASDDESPPDDDGGEMSDAPPLPPKCNPPPAAAAPPGSLPRDFFRSGRAATAPTSWATVASAAAVCRGLASSEDLAIRLPVRCRAAAAGGSDASSSSSSPLSSCSSSSSSSLSSLTVRDAALVVARRPDDHDLHPAAVVAAAAAPPSPPRGGSSPQVADDRPPVAASVCVPTAAVAAAAGGRLPEGEPQPAAPLPSALPAEATAEATAAGGARDSAGEPVQPLLEQVWRGCGPLSPDWDDVFVVDSASGGTEEAMSAAAAAAGGSSSSRRP